jgi:hypothetical protein
MAASASFYCNPDANSYADVTSITMSEDGTGRFDVGHNELGIRN